MEKEQKRPSSHRAIRWRIIALALSLWLAAMGLLTWAVAADMQVQIENLTQDCASWSSRRADSIDGVPEDLPGTMEIGMIDSLGGPYSHLMLRMDPLLPIVNTFDSVGSDDWLWGKWDLYFGFEVAQAYFQEDTLLMDSGNYFTFVYTTQENWLKQDLEPVGRGYVDMDTVSDGVVVMSGYLDSWPIMGDVGLPLFLKLVRMTGYFEGVQFHPVSMDRGSSKYGSNPTLEQMSVADGRENLVWDSILEVPVPADRELETIYVWEMGGIRHDCGPVTVEGKQYDSLTELVISDRESWRRYDSSNLLESVFIWRESKEDSYGAYTYALAVRYWPLQYAALRLVPAYLVSLLLVLLAIWLVLRTIKQNLTRPLEVLVSSNKYNKSITPRAGWAEPRTLEEHYETTRQALHEANTRIAQLTTALEYAKNAEESRRQLVSNITHELKTPLAVIHSYAEGLQAGIAEEKRAHYLNVILEESEKMDAMVLQMLDLSRLEAGRVRLQSDQFSLVAVTRSVAEKLCPLMERKQLEISYGLAEDFSVTADEARICQVISNLMSNAVKYSPVGGYIHINIYTHQGKAYFQIGNDCPHLSDEALEKVWDSFYRADPSRTEPGTGLGLTIVKSIVELHRGGCMVRNITQRTGEEIRTGVEFGFHIPL